MNSSYIISEIPIPYEKWRVAPGEVYNSLIVIGQPFWAKNPNWKLNSKGLIANSQYVRVKCDCGIEKDVACSGLITGGTKSCGKSCRGLLKNKCLKKCTKCKKYLSKKVFGSNKSKKDGLATECLRCRALKNLSQYRMTLDDYDRMLIKQDYKCAICKQVEGSILDDNWQPLCVDHDHISGKVRGLLCRNCNVAIGLLRDNITVLQNAVAYLEGVN